MEGSEGSALQNVRRATDLDSAVAAAIGYHRPSGWTAENPRSGLGFDSRHSYARGLVRTGAPGTDGTQPPSAPGAGEADPHRDEIADLIEGRGPSSRYRRRLPPERIRVLRNRLATALRPEMQAAIESELEIVRQTGQPTRLPDGTTHFERGARILTGNQMARYRLRLEEAYGQYRALHGLQDMTPEEIERHLDSISPRRERDGERFAMVNRNYNMALNARDRMHDAGRTDAAASVETGLVLRGIGRRQREVTGPDGQPIGTSEVDVDHRLQPAREVREAHALVRHRFADDLTFRSDAQGNLTIERREGRPNSERALQEAWGIVMDARLAAQIRRGIPREYRAPITKDEAADLLRLPRRRISDMDQEDFEKAMHAAVVRARERYGPYAMLALNAAVRLVSLSGRQTADARFAFERAIAGQPLTLEDIERMNAMRRIDAEANTWWLGLGETNVPGIEVDRFPDALRLQRRPDIGGIDLPPARFDRATRTEFPVSPNRTERTSDVPGVTISRPTPSPERIAHLRKYPHLWRQFDIDHYDGAAAEYLRE
jgi:hypothetical protein